MPTRAEALRAMAPQLIVDLTLYPTSEGGKKLTIQLGYVCPCLVSKAEPLVGYDDGLCSRSLCRLAHPVEWVSFFSPGQEAVTAPERIAVPGENAGLPDICRGWF